MRQYSDEVTPQQEAVVKSCALLSADAFVFCVLGLPFLFVLVLVLSGVVGSKIRQRLSSHRVESDRSHPNDSSAESLVLRTTCFLQPERMGAADEAGDGSVPCLPWDFCQWPQWSMAQPTHL